MNNVTRYQNAALQYYLDLTGSSYLHYGYWNPIPAPTDDLTVTKLRAAQEAYATHLLSFLPTDIHTVLDVGCGNGGNAITMLERGLQVEGVAPDPLQKANFLEKTNHRAVFHVNTFEEFVQNYQKLAAPPTYDLLLFSESSQYMSPESIAEGASQIVKSGGYLLLSDMLRKDPEYREGMFSNCLVNADLHREMEKNGFKLVTTDDISAHIVPTLDICVQSFQTFGVSTMKYIANLIAIAVPPIYAVLRYFLGNLFKKLITEGLQASNLFHKHLCYEIQLWQKV
ncbi:SAM-dependent methyltransferase [Pseudanabaena mucicola]|uniref:Methyltransferase domain-containing protein n=1 Tax=Pseudanabaena mucicola FACHB-723 TaxID=2692860 RepID=A0ABR7ZXQ0_9CYAN|nr:methyltransferase domain-containing protein [Pseudanabaena mucicola]MBD2188304.1 methyltransferase domain-containing protein [Pseudanabaena mucicola FACHB-723]